MDPLHKHIEYVLVDFHYSVDLHSGTEPVWAYQIEFMLEKLIESCM